MPDFTTLKLPVKTVGSSASTSMGAALSLAMSIVAWLAAMLVLACTVTIVPSMASTVPPGTFIWGGTLTYSGNLRSREIDKIVGAGRTLRW